MARVLIILVLLTICRGYAQFSENILCKPGHFVLGVNYWASHAATEMWVDWNPEVVEQDFKRLSDAGIDVLRIFPIWRDFQPITAIRTFNSGVEDYRFGEIPLPDDQFGNAGVSEKMMERMKILLNLGAKYKIKFIVSLITGQMSHRVFMPPTFAWVTVLHSFLGWCHPVIYYNRWHLHIRR